ncbi:MAG: GNAT family N-acetyltransferase [Chloroflexi bacterium]|nr:GNAT family N-acetyltransferase [Chloroflexota bacterium]
MDDPAELRPSRPPRREATLVHAEIPCAELCRFLYTAVGGDWYWTDRLDWPYDRWRAWSERVETWVAYVRGTPAGYVEIEQQPDGRVRIALLGLLPWAIGQGIGGWLLTRAVERAWTIGATRVDLTTCSLDGPHALNNYLARGFRIVHETTTRVRLPVRTPGPWPGAYP